MDLRPHSPTDAVMLQPASHPREEKLALICDPDERFTQQARGLLADLDIEVCAVPTRDALQAAIESHLPVLIVLERKLGDGDGIELCRALRHAASTRNTPLIFVSALNREEDRIAGFDAGADDYISKPLNAREFVARVKSLLRSAASIPMKEVLRVGPLVLDPNRMEATSSGHPVELTFTEYRILEHLLKNANAAVSRAELCGAVQRPGQQTSLRAIDVYVCRLRAKLEADPHHPNILLNERGRGYMLVAPTNL